jgi:hypothetical protein
VTTATEFVIDPRYDDLIMTQDTTTTVAPSPSPIPDATHAPVATPQAGGVQALNHLMSSGTPDPVAVAALVRKFPSDRTAMFASLQTRLGNAYVQQVVLALERGTQPADEHQTITTIVPLAKQSPAPAIDTGPQHYDGGILGPVTSESASTGAFVTLATPAEAIVTSVEGGRPRFSVAIAVPLADIHANNFTQDQLAAIANVTVMTGPGGTASYKLAGGILQITLAGAPSTNALNATTFKLWLAAGLSVALNVQVSRFHTDITEWTRAGDRSQIAQDQSSIQQLQQMSAATSAEYLPGAQQNLAKDQQALANVQGPQYVMLDANGTPIK